MSRNTVIAFCFNVSCVDSTVIDKEISYSELVSVTYSIQCVAAS
jgi:hypothetical protein